MNARSLLCLAVAGLAIWVAGCADSAEMAPTGTSPQDPPLPRVESIIPMQPGNEWTFHDVIRDTVDPSMADTNDLTLRMPFAYGLTSTDELIRLAPGEYYFNYTFVEYYCAYEWEGLNRGALLTYRDVGVPVRGVYIVGTYDFTVSQTPVWFDTAQLWLAYPAADGATWQYQADSATVVTMELVDHDTLLYFVDKYSGTASPLQFVSCYLYRQQDTFATRYYFYHRSFGPLGYQFYTPSGVLQRTYLLTSFHGGADYSPYY